MPENNIQGIRWFKDYDGEIKLQFTKDGQKWHDVPTIDYHDVKYQQYKQKTKDRK